MTGAVGANRQVLFAFALVMAISGCASRWATQWPAHETPAVDLPPASAAMAPLSIDRQWWKIFGDPILDGLVEDALANNFDLAKAAANVAEARANTLSVRALRSPRVDGLAKVGATQRQL